MKQIKLAVVAIFTLLTTSTLVAQDANNPWAVTVGINAVDVYSPLENHPNAFPDFTSSSKWIASPSWAIEIPY